MNRGSSERLFCMRAKSFLSFSFSLCFLSWYKVYQEEQVIDIFPRSVDFLQCKLANTQDKEDKDFRYFYLFWSDCSEKEIIKFIVVLGGEIICSCLENFDRGQMVCSFPVSFVFPSYCVCQHLSSFSFSICGKGF